MATRTKKITIPMPESIWTKEEMQLILSKHAFKVQSGETVGKPNKRAKFIQAFNNPVKDSSEKESIMMDFKTVVENVANDLAKSFPGMNDKDVVDHSFKIARGFLLSSSLKGSGENVKASLIQTLENMKANKDVGFKTDLIKQMDSIREGGEPEVLNPSDPTASSSSSSSADVVDVPIDAVAEPSLAGTGGISVGPGFLSFADEPSPVPHAVDSLMESVLTDMSSLWDPNPPPTAGRLSPTSAPIMVAGTSGVPPVANAMGNIKKINAGSGGEGATLPNEALMPSYDRFNMIDGALAKFNIPPPQLEYIDFQTHSRNMVLDQNVQRDQTNKPKRMEMLDKALWGRQFDPEEAVPNEWFKLNNSYAEPAKSNAKSNWEKYTAPQVNGIGSGWFGPPTGTWLDDKWVQGDNPFEYPSLESQPSGAVDWTKFATSMTGP